MKRTGTAVSTGRRAMLAVFLLAALTTPSRLLAAGDEHTLRGKDLQLTVSTRWAGCSSGGYYPIRIRVQNRGVDCTVTFKFDGGSEGLASVQRTIAIAQNATVKFTLPVPCVGYGTYGKLTVRRDGELVESLTRTLSIPDRHSSGAVRPAMLVISPTEVDFGPFETAVVSTTPSVSSSSYGSHGYYGMASENHERIDPTMLPEEWIAYSGLDFVALTLSTLEAMSNTERSALLKWVHTGGSLIVYGVGAAAGDSRPLNDLLEVDQHAAVSSAWEPADLSQRRPIRIVRVDDYGNVLQETEESDSQSSIPQQRFLWSDDADAFAARDLMLGHVYAFRDDPFSGSPQDWAWFLKAIPDDARQWTTRQGISARYGTREFLQFLIPSVRGVPVIPFLLLITLFTIVIGPLNYIFLWRRRRLSLLLVTIPLIALATSLTLFGYSAIAHGFATKSRARTLTYVDQTARSAVTQARIALYAGLAPSDGLRFSADTMVMPIWPEDHEFKSATTDWTEQQNLASGWLNSRTRTQFLTVGHREERGRLEITPGDQTLSVTNGFEWDLQTLVVCDRSDRLWFADQVPAGGSAELELLNTDQQEQIRHRVDEYPLTSPDLLGSSSGGWFDWDVGGYYGYDPSQDTSFSTGRLERLIGRFKGQNSARATIPPGSYAAIVSENPGVELGMERTRPQASLHLLMGRY